MFIQYPDMADRNPILLDNTTITSTSISIVQSVNEGPTSNFWEHNRTLWGHFTLSCSTAVQGMFMYN